MSMKGIQISSTQSDYCVIIYRKCLDSETSFFLNNIVWFEIISMSEYTYFSQFNLGMHFFLFSSRGWGEFFFARLKIMSLGFEPSLGSPIYAWHQVVVIPLH